MVETNQATIDLLNKWLHEPVKTVKYHDPYVWFGYFHSANPLYLLPALFYEPPDCVQRVIECPDYRVTLCWLRFAISVGLKVRMAVVMDT